MLNLRVIQQISGRIGMYPEAFVHYMAHFHGDRDYFECHEILEEHWKEHDKGNKDSIWVAFIQLAVGCYHHRRGNVSGASRTLQKALAIFVNKESEIDCLGVDGNILIRRVKKLIARIN